MKKFLTMILSLLMIISNVPMLAFSVAAQDDDLSQSEEDIPSNAIAINSVWELSMICNEYPSDGYYYLTRDLDMSVDVAENGDFYDDGKGWTPIGGKSLPFAGTFDGKGYTIKNLKINRTTSYVGLFGYANGAKIFNLNLENGDIIGGQNTAGVIGGAENSEFCNLKVSNYTIKGSTIVGGIIGGGTEISLYDCTMDLGTVESTGKYCGGISGQLTSMTSQTVYNCVNNADITGATSYIGGLFGEFLGTDAVIDSCQNNGNVTGTSSYVAGIVGNATAVKIQNCENIGNIDSKTGYSVTSVGGIAGKCQEVNNCVNRGAITAVLKAYTSEDTDGPQSTSYAGGIVGDAEKVYKCFNTGSLYVAGGKHHYWQIVGSGTSIQGGSVKWFTKTIYTYGGGIAGNATTVDLCYNTGEISSPESDAIGAIIGGDKTVTVSNCYSDANNLPLVRKGGSTIINCYNTNGTISPSGTATSSYYYTDEESGIGDLRTKRQLRASITFVDWDFDTIWTFDGNEDYRFPEFIDLPSEFVKSVISVSLVSTPEKTTYLEGKEVLDLSQLKLKVSYDNDTQEEIDVTEDMVSGFNNSVVGSQTVKVSYQGLCAEFSVVIVAKSVESIEMASLPAKLGYLEGKDVLDLTDAQIRVYYNNDTTKLINLTSSMISGFDNTIVGEQTLFVEYQEKTTEFNIEIIPKSVIGIEIHTPPQVLDYKEGDRIDLSGGVITILYDNDTSEQKDISECEISVTELSTYGQLDVVVVYDGFETTFSVNVGHNYSDQYSYDSDFHWFECACGGISEKLPHEYDNTCDTNCNICSHVRTITHTYSSDCDEICNICGDERIAPTEHIYDNNCDTMCNDCYNIRTVPDHIYQNDCDTDCDECGAPRTVPDHVYDNDCDIDCNICGAQRTPDVHKVNTYTITNSTSYPFALNDGVYSSTNKVNGSYSTFTLTALHDSTIKIHYYTSTEQNYDKLIISHNNTSKVTVSGETSWAYTTIEVKAGDKIYIKYSKDSSQSSGHDKIYFRIDDESNYIPAENLSPTCEDDVICDECGAIVKEALGHKYSYDCDSSCDRCGYIRTAAAHKYDNSCDTTCNVCSETRSITHTYSHSCDTICNVCSTTRTVTHSYDNACDTTCNNSLCDYIRTVPDHIYTNTCDTNCNICGNIRTITHTYSSDCDTICNICGDFRIVPTDHSYDNACDTTCNYCGNTRSVPDHVYQNACDTECDICTFLRAVPDHVYDNDCDANCNICNAYRTTDVHKVKNYTLTNAIVYPFALNDGVYSSTNKADNSTATVTLTVLYDGTITFHYYTSTEQNYDTLIIKHNNTDKVTLSGETSWASYTFQVKAGDAIYISYRKDSSVSEGNDTIYFKIDESSYIPAETLSPTCEDNVICDKCGTIVKTSLGHKYDNACDASCNTCGKTRIVPDHIYQNACDTDCDACGLTRTVPDHKYDNTCDTTCNNCDYVRTITHRYSSTCDEICNVCGEERIAISNHKYSNACDKDCNVCSHIRTVPDHIYQNACDTDCDECGTVRTVPEHKYDNACDKDCSICGYVRTITHKYQNACDTDCDKCGLTREVPDHKYDNTCDKDCNICDHVRTITHTYSSDCDEHCNICGYECIALTEHIYDNEFDAICDMCGHTRNIANVTGDINSSGDIDSMDYVLLKRAYFGTYKLSNIIVGDINDNGEIDSMDYVYLRRAYFGTYAIK